MKQRAINKDGDARLVVRELEHLMPTGYEGLAEQIVKSAIDEYKLCVKNDVIKDGELTGHWPCYVGVSQHGNTIAPKKQIAGMRTKQEAQDLIDFLRGDWCKWLLRNLSDHDLHSRMLDALGLSTTKCAKAKK